MSETVTIWVTKYALTDGVRKFEVPAGDVDDRMVVIRPQSLHEMTWYVHGKGRDWHQSEEEALKRAEVMRVDKIASAERQIQRLRNLAIKVKARGEK